MAIQKLDYSTWMLFKDVAPFLHPYRGRLAGSTLCRIVSDVAWLYPPYGLALLVNFLTTYQPGASLTPVWTIFTLFGVAFTVRYFGIYAAKILMYKTSERVDLDLQLASMQHLFKLDIAWHEKENTGNKLKKVGRGAESADRILRIWIDNILEIVVNFVGITVVIATFDTTIAFLTALYLATYYVLAYFLRREASHAAIVVNAAEEDVQGLLFESLNNIRTVKVLGMARALMRVLETETKILLEKIYKRVFWFQAGGAARGWYTQICQFGILIFVVIGIIQGQYAIGFLVLFYTYFGRLVESVSELANITQDYVIAKLSVGRMFEIIREPISIDLEEDKVSFPSSWQKITLKDVSFGYGDNKVLENVSLEIRRGEKVGIVGLSGAGKSTLFKLLLKEHESYTGEILIDDVPLSSISKQDYFKYSAVVLQDTEVFNFSLRENIMLANETEAHNQELFERALRVAHVEDFIRRLPEGVHTLIGEKGVRLSGGERQRLGIARAVFKNPELLLLDEATSHLDIESEGKIRSSLHEFFRSVTAIVIAHRLTTIKEMDRIVVIEGGRIIEEGSFTDLYARKGRFHELWDKQSL